MGTFLRNYFAFLPVLFDVTFVSNFISICRNTTLQVSIAEIYSYIMILNSNMIFWTPILEYLIFVHSQIQTIPFSTSQSKKEN